MTRNLCPTGRELSAAIDYEVDRLKVIKSKNTLNATAFGLARARVYDALVAYFYHKNGLPNGACGCPECGGRP